MALSKVDWDECDELLDESGILRTSMDYTSLFFSETYGYFLNLSENQDGLYCTDDEDEKHYFELWTTLLPIIPKAHKELRQIFEPLCKDGLEGLKKGNPNFSSLCTFVEQMISAKDKYVKNELQ
ncbi:hypothetical protein BN1723_010362 [Verticillium longisporum]|uniref:Uncharacterized protein n=2 Tax=Verticillium TaxID=1036719 RepID=G2X3D8_VERDV|nr:uncharacterized protein VDAG_04923 [Verticillium dahliae VdLs.17]KAG7153185.1 hypothetical protein HYQ46_012038 [Verticillium longisporum]KAH6708493.1 hypothetical protein EV126DRAFT_332438 [Verticillium dahliae]EGY23485.1 hypothetical protein VDAG_04923 [Verticillium dahliae VdLs.17]CRK14527.1 hypothetical protein BN1723_010362 [Verticillium longisporum]CRK15985.1 hypothetical protein BN1708_011616 [Verticillium longisporum]